MSYAKSDRAAQRRFRALRLSFLVFFLVLSTALGILHQHSTALRPVGVDALDPFGGIESAITLAVTGQMLQRIAWSSFILLFATIAAALVFRRVFCGKVCALGALQELFGRLGRRIFRRRLEVPRAVDRPARYLKYATLAGIVAVSAITGTLWIRPYDPWAAYHHLFSAELISGFLVGLILLIVTVVGSVLYDRFFCKYLCPMGAFLGLINRVGWYRVRRNDESCIHCYACDRACPVNIPVESMDQVQSSECINCNLCVSRCPVQNTLFLAGPGGRGARKASPFLALGVTLGIFAAVLGATTAVGGFEWTIRPLGQAVLETGAFNPDEIKGSDTFRAVAEITGIPEQAFLERFGISRQQFDGPIRDATHAAGSTFDTEAVREFVREQLAERRR
jgi:polyferredoxin